MKNSSTTFHRKKPYYKGKDWSVKNPISKDDFIPVWGTRFEDYDTRLKEILLRRQQAIDQRENRKKHIQALRDKGLTLKEIGLVFGVSRERIRQILQD